MRIIVFTVIVLVINSFVMTGQEKIATLGGGCFWCTEAFFAELDGVSNVVSGYSGGAGTDPTYKEICSGLTGHAEVIQVTYDSQKIEFTDLLEIFFATHNPTTLNRQGADVGTQYRSVIFYHDDEQKRIAELVIKELDDQKIFDNAIITEVSAFDRFFEAEGYHQDYFANNPKQPYCNAVITPKMDKFKKLFIDRLKK